MCTKLDLRVKSISVAGVKRSYVPCGKCYDCQNKMRQDWVFRLRYDLDALKKKGWKIGFFTLTYSDEFIPHIPYALFDNPDECCRIPCFDKSDVRDFLVRLKKAALKKYGVKKLRYMVCSEYGENTRRPHYHGIVCFPPEVDEQWMFEKIHDIWYRGFVFPRDFVGGLDSHGYMHNPFICDSVKAAAVYAAKYCCKDIGYMSDVSSYKFRRERFMYRYDVVESIGCMLDDVDLWRDEWTTVPVTRLERRRIGDEPCVVYKLSDYMPFHMQTRQLGFEFINLSEEKKIYALRNGFSFLGDDFLSPLPVYIREKILFTPKYVLRNGKRMVEREATQFFIEHCEEVFDAKVKVISERFAQMRTVDYWRGLGSSVDDADTAVKAVAALGDSDNAARNYLAYYGVNYFQCYGIPQSLQWLRRYTDRLEVGDCPLIPLCVYKNLYKNIFTLFAIYNKLDYTMCHDKLLRKREVDYVRDFYKHQL